jgi:hypothetical protein
MAAGYREPARIITPRLHGALMYTPREDFDVLGGCWSSLRAQSQLAISEIRCEEAWCVTFDGGQMTVLLRRAAKPPVDAPRERGVTQRRPGTRCE